MSAPPQDDDNIDYGSGSGDCPQRRRRRAPRAAKVALDLGRRGNPDVRAALDAQLVSAFGQLALPEPGSVGGAGARADDDGGPDPAGAAADASFPGHADEARRRHRHDPGGDDPADADLARALLPDAAAVDQRAP